MGIVIRPITGEGAKEALALYEKEPTMFEPKYMAIEDMFRVSPYEVVRQGVRVAYFGLTHWENDKQSVLCFVIVKEPYRRKGLFWEIVEFAKKRTPKNHALLINASKGNILANFIYRKRFLYLGDDGDLWYEIKKKPPQP